MNQHKRLYKEENVQKSQPVVVQGNVPAFLLKLWKIVEDESCNSYISWSQNGETFRVHDQISFAKEILPKYYKHNNFSSFVRQVNMYGFRKIVDPRSGSMKLDKDEWEFFHPHFKQGQPDKLQYIKRKVHAKDEKIVSPQLSHLLQDVEKLKGQAEFVNSKLDLVKTENEMLWREVADLRERHHNQQNVINKVTVAFHRRRVLSKDDDLKIQLIQFFVQLVMGKSSISRKRQGIEFPALAASKKMKKDLELQSYNPSSLQQLFHDAPYTVHTPASTSSEDRITELSPVNLSLIDNDSQPTTNSTNGLQPDSIYSDTDDIPYLVEPASVPEISNNENSSDSNTQPYLEQACTAGDAGCNAVSESPFVFPVEFTPTDTTRTTVISEGGSSSTLSTPTVSMPSMVSPAVKQIKTHNSYNKERVLTTPTIALPPAVQRQNSFSDRSQVMDDVESISKNLEVLQEILAQKQINIDLKNLDMLPDLIRLTQKADEDNKTATTTTTTPAPLSSNELFGEGSIDDYEQQFSPSEGQLVPYTEPFSPSQVLRSDFNPTAPSTRTERPDYLDSVLGEE